MRSLVLVSLVFVVTAQILAQSIPPTTGTLLSGQSIVLPKDLTARHTILILGFNEKSAASSTGWDKEARALAGSIPSVASYQLPVLESVPRLIRGIVVRSMKKDVPAAVQSTFLPIFENEKEWKQVVEFSSPDDAYIVLIDAHGQIIWKTHGSPSPQQLKQLRYAVANSQ